MAKEFYWRTGRSCVFKNFIHLVFVPKYRKDVFTQAMLTRLHEIFSETCAQMDVELLEFGGNNDHIHLMVCCPPKLAISNLVSKLKGKSSYILRREFWHQIKKKLWKNHFWSPSYCMVSCGGTPLEIIKKYIVDQKRPSNEHQITQSKKFTGRKRDKNKNWLA